MELGVSKAAPIVFVLSAGHCDQTQFPDASGGTGPKHFGHKLFSATLYSVTVARSEYIRIAGIASAQRRLDRQVSRWPRGLEPILQLIGSFS